MSQVIDGLSWFALVGGAVFCVIGGVGALRMPDLYTRLHAASITDTMGAGLILVGLLLQAGPTLVAIKLALVLAFLLFTSPVSGHALVKAAYYRGLAADLQPPDNPGPGQQPAPRDGDGAAAGGAQASHSADGEPESSGSPSDEGRSTKDEDPPDHAG